MENINSFDFLNLDLNLVELDKYEIETIEGGVVPLLALAIPIAKGFAWGFGVATAAYGAIAIGSQIK